MTTEPKRNQIAAISVGDLNGIGLEVILKSLSDDRILEMITPVLFASQEVVKAKRKQLELSHMQLWNVGSMEKIKEGQVNLIDCWEEQPSVQAGVADPELAGFTLRSLDAACQAVEEGAADFLVTAPLDKSLVAQASEGFTGHTGYLETKLEGDALMILCSDQLRVALVTGHIPVSEVASSLSIEGIMNRLSQLNRSLKNDFGIQRPRIAVLGLNPHNGDKGVIGKEEQDIIQPAVERAFRQEILAFGPFSPDGFFGTQEYQKFDGVLAMYHDQGLIPFKMLGFETGVNFTAGLSLVRTSPDHGTAFDIAAAHTADHGSFREALYLGRQIAMHRKLEEQIRSNPLQASKRSTRDS